MLLCREASVTDRNGPAARALRPEILLLGAFILALCVRMLYINQIASTPLLHGLALDSKEYDSLSIEILKGNFTHQDFVYLNAFYPFFLASIYSVFGHSPLAAALVQAIVDALSCVLIYYVSLRVFSRTVALIAAFTYAFYGIAIFYTGILLGTTVVIFLTLLLVASLLFAKQKSRPTLFCISGVVFGLLVLARSNLILFFLVILPWFFSAVKKEIGLAKTVRGFGLFSLGFLLITSAISVRNYAIDKRLSPFSVQGGINFYIGNNPKATGRFMSPEGVSVTPVRQVKTSIRSAEQAVGSALTPSEASRYWLVQGLRFIRDNPVDAIILYAKKFGLFWRKEEIPLNINYYLSRNLAPLFQFPFVSFGIVAPLAVLGIVLCARRRDDVLFITLIIMTSMVSVIVFFVAARYRMCAVPFLIMFSSFAIHGLVQMMRAKEFRRLFVLSGFLVALSVGINFGFDDLMEAESVSKLHYRNLGLAYMREGRLDLAVAQLERALSFDPTFAEAHSSLGFALQRQGRVDEAIPHFMEAIALKPELEEAHNNLGAIFLQQGRLDEAIGHFRQVLRINSDHVQAHQNLGAALVRQRKLKEGVRHLLTALQLNPNSAEAHYNLGLALTAQGKFDDAKEHLAEAARIDPALKQACQSLQRLMTH